MSKRRKGKDPIAQRKARQQNLLHDQHHEAPKSLNPLQERVVGWVLRRGRLSRILLIAWIALMITLATGVLFYTVDTRFLLSDDGMSVSFILYIPVIVATVLGLIVYLVGWVYVVDVYEVEESAPNVILWYLGFGGFATLINLGWILNVISVLSNP